MPLPDMQRELRAATLPLLSLETHTPLRDFDVVGFSLQYEMGYTNILAMLDLAGIPFYAKDRDEHWPLIVAGGPCVCNGEPVADFFDAMMLGEGEEQLPALCETVIAAKKAGLTRRETLEKLAQIEGVYVPALYHVTYRADGRIDAVLTAIRDANPVPATETQALNDLQAALK